MRLYHSKADNWIITVLMSSVVLLWVLLIPATRGCTTLTPAFVIGGFNLAFSWFIYDLLNNTYYFIEDGTLRWRTGIFKGDVIISDIHTISRANSIMDVSALIKPCLTAKPLIIKHNRYEETPISPKEEELLISELRKQNPDISLDL